MDVAEIIERGRAHNPRVTVADEAISPLIRHRLEGEDHPERLDADEVFLACACALGDATAISTFEQRYFPAFKGAFEAAVATLSSRERSLLELTILKRVSIDKLGALYGVHRATAARWVQSARENLTRAVHQILSERLAVPAADLDNLLPLVES